MRSRSGQGDGKSSAAVRTRRDEFSFLRRMFTPASLRQLDAWLSARTTYPSRPSIVIGGRPGDFPREIAGDLANYLTGVAGDEREIWLGFSAAELMKLAEHPLEIFGGPAINGIPEYSGGAARGAKDCNGYRRYRGALRLARHLAWRGACVIQLPGAGRATQDLPDVFHAWIGPPLAAARETGEAIRLKGTRRMEQWMRRLFGENSGAPLRCHLAVDPLEFTGGALIRVIGDSALEWAEARERLAAMRRALRTAQKTHAF